MLSFMYVRSLVTPLAVDHSPMVPALARCPIAPVIESVAMEDGPCPT